MACYERRLRVPECSNWFRGIGFYRLHKTPYAFAGGNLASKGVKLKACIVWLKHFSGGGRKAESSSLPILWLRTIQP